MGPDRPGHAQDTSAILRAEIASIHRTGMGIEQEDLIRLKRPAALPDGQGAAGRLQFERVSRGETVDENPCPAPANLIPFKTCDLLQQGPARANKSVLLEPVSCFMRRLERDQIGLRNIRRPGHKIEPPGHAIRAVPDNIGPVDQAGGDEQSQAAAHAQQRGLRSHRADQFP